MMKSPEATQHPWEPEAAGGEGPGRAGTLRFRKALINTGRMPFLETSFSTYWSPLMSVAATANPKYAAIWVGRRKDSVTPRWLVWHRQPWSKHREEGAVPPTALQPHLPLFCLSHPHGNHQAPRRVYSPTFMSRACPGYIISVASTHNSPAWLSG